MTLGLRWHRFDDGPPADLSAFVDGELRGRRRRQVARHLRGCPACRLVVEQLRRVRALTAELAVEDPGPAVASPDGSRGTVGRGRNGRRRRE